MGKVGRRVGYVAVWRPGAGEENRMAVWRGGKMVVGKGEDLSLAKSGVPNLLTHEGIIPPRPHMHVW